MTSSSAAPFSPFIVRNLVALAILIAIQAACGGNDSTGPTTTTGTTGTTGTTSTTSTTGTTGTHHHDDRHDRHDHDRGRRRRQHHRHRDVQRHQHAVRGTVGRDGVSCTFNASATGATAPVHLRLETSRIRPTTRSSPSSTPTQSDQSSAAAFSIWRRHLQRHRVSHRDARQAAPRAPSRARSRSRAPPARAAPSAALSGRHAASRAWRWSRCFGRRPAHAQQSLQVPVQFDFLNPSARSLALGSAFVGLADDATAALVNPAGLIALTGEGSVARGALPPLHAAVSGRRPALGRRRPAGTGHGGGPGLRRHRRLRTWAPSFMSFVYPRGRFRLAAFRHELIRVDQDFESIGVFQNRMVSTIATPASPPARTLDDRQLRRRGGLSNCRTVWIGGGVMAQRFSLGFEFDRFVATERHLSTRRIRRRSVFHFSQNGERHRPSARWPA